MNKKDAMKWVKALRSGKYKQTKGILKNSKGFCCLGVLCEINQNAKPNALNDSISNFRKMGLRSSTGELQDYAPQEWDYPPSLAELNDEYKYNFQEIADVIQIEYVEGL